MSSPSELVDVLSRVANIFLKAVDALENRMMMIEQRIDELERAPGGYGASAASSSSRREPTAPAPVYPSMTQDTRRAPTSTPPASYPPAPQPQAYGSSQQQWGSQRQDSYSQPPSPSYQSRPPAPAYPPQGQQQGYGPQGQAPMQQGPPGPRPPSSPLNIRQAVTGELKDVFARMRARAEGRQ